MEFLIALACIFLLIVAIQVFLYRLRKREKKNLSIDYNRLIEYMDAGNYKDSSGIMENLLRNPHLTLKQLATVKSYIEQMRDSDFDRSEIDKLLDFVYQKEAHYNIRIEYHGEGL